MKRILLAAAFAAAGALATPAPASADDNWRIGVQFNWGNSGSYCGNRCQPQHRVYAPSPPAYYGGHATVPRIVIVPTGTVRVRVATCRVYETGEEVCGLPQ